MNDKQREIIDKLNKDNEALNQGHKSMVEYSKGMICIGLFVVCFLIYYFTKNIFFLLGFLSFEIFNLIYAKNDKKKIGIGIIVGVVIFKIKIVREHINLIDRKVIWINELVVDEKLRGKGIGTKLFNETKKYAKNNKCDAVELNCWEFNEKALRFYERCGMNTQRRIMDLKINIYQ